MFKLRFGQNVIYPVQNILLKNVLVGRVIFFHQRKPQSSLPKAAMLNTIDNKAWDFNWKQQYPISLVNNQQLEKGLKRVGFKSRREMKTFNDVVSCILHPLPFMNPHDLNAKLGTEFENKMRNLTEYIATMLMHFTCPVLTPGCYNLRMNVHFEII